MRLSEMPDDLLHLGLPCWGVRNLNATSVEEIFVASLAAYRNQVASVSFVDRLDGRVSPYERALVWTTKDEAKAALRLHREKQLQKIDAL